jgi:rhodanese-related sulfurtransferase
MSGPPVKEALFDEFAQIGKALSSGRRAEIIDVLVNGERSVEGIALETGLSIANASQHLQVLKSSGLVRARRQGTFVYYRIASSEVTSFWRSLQQIARQSRAEVERLVRAYLGDDDVEAVTKEELWRRVRRKGDVLVLDVRPPEEYMAGHIPGAVSIPLEELKRRLKELPRDKQIVAYCRGPVCAFAPQAARYLKTKGYDVKRLKEGIPEWGAAGLPVESGS